MNIPELKLIAFQGIEIIKSIIKAVPEDKRLIILRTIKYYIDKEIKDIETK